MPEFILSDDREATEEQIAKKLAADKRGEEGYLYKVQLPLEDGNIRDAYAKRWYRSFDYPFSLPLEYGGAALSPYWHARIALQYELINEAFPDNTATMIGGYDPRISRPSENRPLFRVVPGRPTTVTTEAKGDPKLVKAYEELVIPHYAELHAYKDDILRRTGQRILTDDPFIQEGRDEIDRKIRLLLGEDIMLAPRGANISDREDLVRQIRRRNPNNIMATMIESGIHPIHPEMNFVPGSRDTHRDPPYGTFIELDIHDPQALHRKMSERLRGNQAALSAFERKLKAYLTYKKLDELYAEMVFSTSYGNNDQLKFEEIVQDAFYKLMEALRKGCEREIISLEDQEITERVKSAVKQAFQNSTANIIAASILAITQRVSAMK